MANRKTVQRQAALKAAKDAETRRDAQELLAEVRDQFPLPSAVLLYSTLATEVQTISKSQRKAHDAAMNEGRVTFDTALASARDGDLKLAKQAVSLEMEPRQLWWCDSTDQLEELIVAAFDIASAHRCGCAYYTGLAGELAFVQLHRD